MKFSLVDFWRWYELTFHIETESYFDDSGNRHGFEIRQDSKGLYWKLEIGSGWESHPWFGYIPTYSSGEGWDKNTITVLEVKKIVIETYIWQEKIQK